MYQESWPFESAIHGVVAREDFEPEDEEEGERAPGLSENDVFIVEGQQERYGNKDA